MKKIYIAPSVITIEVDTDEMMDVIADSGFRTLNDIEGYKNGDDVTGYGFKPNGRTVSIWGDD